METPLALSFEIIRIRSQIAEALLSQMSTQENPKEQRFIAEAAYYTSDVIEHIAQDALNGEFHAPFLIQSLENALRLLDKRSILQNCKHNLPSENTIKALIQQLEATP
ncbi:hypothetical protein [Vibrio parahaemolyticus]|uniref:hypothetical protein n=1 Tax=Vibrio parahaemolyticus TaxID=670 RepID=UPI0017872119|nr:hypothetical protein [Vibrio parahaemolyticus]MBD6945037.1 hypothetical protein [Vibrio parahaemolyticus]MBD6978934.1 hypothetical protein [Vibrio parahaemolyticus]MBD6990939.1 hypothetical protein [Vibrio parahaemolyticus]WOZ62900.1 hypothetical protein RHS38_26145 [Vibrio parahaemolyticus]